MRNGFLDNLPDLGFENRARRRVRKAEKKNQPIIYKKLRCPECGSDKVPIHTTKKPIRYHKCGNCGHNFKSVEQ